MTIFVNSIPKSGTNLLAKLLNLSGLIELSHLSTGTFRDATCKAKILKSLFETSTGGFEVGVDSPIFVRAIYCQILTRIMCKGTYCTGHVKYSKKMASLFEKRKIKTILVTRDPRAVLSSFVPYVLSDKQHFLNKEISGLPIEEVYKYCLYGSNNFLSLVDRFNSMVLWLDCQNVLSVKFEDLIGPEGNGCKMKQESTIRNLSEFTGIDYEVLSDRVINLFGPGRHTFRKGKIDSWKEDIPQLLMREVNENLSPVLEKMGYSL